MEELNIQIKTKADAENFLKNYTEFSHQDFIDGEFWFRYDGPAHEFRKTEYTINHETEGYIGATKEGVIDYIFRNRKRLNNAEPIMITKAVIKQPENEKLMYTDSFGDTFEVFPKINMYRDNDNLYMGLDAYDEDIGGKDAYCDVTVNISSLPYLHSAIDLTYGREEKVKFLQENGFGHFNGQRFASGFCIYPVFVFNEDKLRQIDPVAFNAYAKAHGRDKTSLDSQISEAEKKTGSGERLSEQKEQER